MPAKKKILPNLLNYTRSLIPSNGEFYFLDKENHKQPILVQKQTVRGTISNYSNIPRQAAKVKNQEAEVEKLLDPANANIQPIDTCYLPHNINHFYLKFSLTIAANSLHAGACNDENYTENLEKFATTYKTLKGYDILAEQYLQNLINARWMWRNRYATDKKVTIEINQNDKNETVDFQVKNDLDSDYSNHEKYTLLRDAISHALSGDSEVLRLDITGSGVLGFGQEVYPSQEFIEGKKDKTLASIALNKNRRQARMHSQKIGNALRTIDDWHPEATKYGKLPVEPYGVVQQYSQATRLPKTKQDLYTYLINLETHLDTLKQAKTKDEIKNEAHYMMACFIRGGVYSGGKK